MHYLSNDQLTTLLTAIISVAGTLLGVLAANWGSHRQLVRQLADERQKEIRLARRDKLEELYMLTKEFFDVLQKKHSVARLTIDHHLPREVYLNLLPSETGPLPRMKVLVDLYFHDIFPAFRPVAESVGDFYQILIRLEQSLAVSDSANVQTIGKEIDEWLGKFMSQFQQLEHAIYAVSDPQLRVAFSPPGNYGDGARKGARKGARIKSP